MDTLICQDHITHFLKNHIDTPPHLMFFGPSGCGKTSMARAFIHAYLSKHGVPADEHKNYILLLNSVDDRGIGTIRGQLTEFVRRTRRYPAVKAWVWMDDADSVPVVSQQALRRILENYEPYTRFLFVAAGPEPFIEPLQSRCVMLQFLPVNLVFNKEFFHRNSKLKISPDAEAWMMSMSLGNARLYKLFHQMLDATGMTEVTASDVQAIVNAPPVRQLEILGRAVLVNDRVGTLKALLNLWSAGYCFEDIIYLLEIVCRIYNFFSPEETQRLYLKCGEGHIAMILNKTRLLDALAVFTAPTVLGPFISA
jgi:ATPase family associated with various cellular activities (AAA)